MSIDWMQEAKRTSAERSMAVGSLGEIIVGLKGGVTQFTPVSFPSSLWKRNLD